jgi:hypothetical protein
VAQVMYDRAILFVGQVYSVTQTWKGKEIIVTATPANEQLCELIRNLIRKHGQITLRETNGVFEIVQP